MWRGKSWRPRYSGPSSSEGLGNKCGSLWQVMCRVYVNSVCRVFVVSIMCGGGVTFVVHLEVEEVTHTHARARAHMEISPQGDLWKFLRFI